MPSGHAHDGTNMGDERDKDGLRVMPENGRGQSWDTRLVIRLRRVHER